MAKICLTENMSTNVNIHKLWELYSVKDFGILTEIKRDKISSVSTLYEVFKRSKADDFSWLQFQNEIITRELNELALWRNKLWPISKRISVKFIDNNPLLENKIIEYANEWSEYANIHFDFIKSGSAEIRISLKNDGTSWSVIGTDALDIPQNIPTMNFGWFDNFTPNEEIRRTTLHEFGHAIGCIHEHQTFDCPIKWDKIAVYNEYLKHGWSRQKVDNNIFGIFKQSEITNSVFDRNSIMLYPVDKNLTLDKLGTDMNMELSENDKKFISSCYPF
jgi:serralysin